MPRVTITPRTVALGAFPVLPVVAGSLDLIWLAADAANKEQAKWTGKEIILAWNGGAVSRTITVTSVAIRGRTGDVTAYSIAAATISILPLPLVGFVQSVGGYLFFEASHADVLFAVLKIAD